MNFLGNCVPLSIQNMEKGGGVKVEKREGNGENPKKGLGKQISWGEIVTVNISYYPP